MIPDIEFRYSYIYDESYRNSSDIKEFLKKINKRYPSRNEVIEFLSKIKNAWKKEGNDILNKI